MAGRSKSLDGSTLEMVAERFRILGDPLRLRLLHSLGERERTVADLVEATGGTQANVSKHLQLLLRSGLVERRKEGLFVHYRVTDPAIFSLCDAVCGSLADRLERDLARLRPTPPPRKQARRKAG